MLVANTNGVKTFKVTSGDEIMGEVISDNTTTVTVKNPVVVTMTPLAGGQMQVNLVPVMIGVPKACTVNFYKNNLLTEPATVRPEAEAQYRKVTS